MDLGLFKVRHNPGILELIGMGEESTKMHDIKGEG